VWFGIPLFVVWLGVLRITAADYWCVSHFGFVSISYGASPVAGPVQDWPPGSFNSYGPRIRVGGPLLAIPSPYQKLWDPFVLYDARTGIERVSVIDNAWGGAIPREEYISFRLPYKSLAAMDAAARRDDLLGFVAACRTSYLAYPDRWEFAALLSNALYRLGRTAEADLIVEPILHQVPADWREEFLHTWMKADYDSAHPIDPARANVWPSRYSDVYQGNYRKPFDFQAIDLLAEWTTWDNPCRFHFEPLIQGYYDTRFRDRSFHDVAVATAGLEMLGGDAERGRDILLGLLKWKAGGRSETTYNLAHWNEVYFGLAIESWSWFIHSTNMTSEELTKSWELQEQSLDDRGWETWEDFHLLVATGEALDRIGEWPNRFRYMHPDQLRANTDRVRSQLHAVRQAVRIRFERLATGSWPTVDASGRMSSLTLRADPPPIDTYAADGGFRYIAPASSEEAFVVYSIGPDGVDDSGAVWYDPTNGSMSAGDLILRISP